MAQDNDYEEQDEASPGPPPSRPQRGDRRQRPSRGQQFGRGKPVGPGCGPRCIGYKGATVSYKQVDVLRRFVTDRGKIRPRRQTGNCAKHQRMLSRAIKRARYMALLPFTAEHIFPYSE